MTGTATILWRRVGTPGHESARLAPHGDGWLLAGSSVFAHEGRPCRLDYRVGCDAAWHTCSARVEGWVGEEEIDVSIEVDLSGRWKLNGELQPQVQGCIDVDLSFSPSTNLLPIRRLSLEEEAEAEVRAAWLRFPGFTLEPLPQVYRRLSDDAYRYESAGGAFIRDLEVNAAGFVTEYPGFFTQETAG
jgi:hypothetical protein